MLEKIDLTQTLDKAEYKSVVSELEWKAGEIQREARKENIPIIVVYEGWDAAGKGTHINRLILSLDPRGFTVYPINQPNEEEKLRPFLWRFWVKTPERGRIAFFDRSWYGRVLVERIDKLVKKKVWSKAYQEIVNFERQLVDDDVVIIKFFLHIDKKEQKKRFKKLIGNPVTSWKVTEEDWTHHKQYNHYQEAIEEMLVKTSTGLAPWTIIEAHDRRFAVVKMYRTFIEAIEKKIQVLRRKTKADLTNAALNANYPALSKSVLDKIDLSATMDRETYKPSLKTLQQRVWELEHEIYTRRIPVVIVYQGWDAGGKGGNIKRHVQGMDPRGYEVVPIGAPNDIEKSHHYLWRFWKRFPKAGHIMIFDRSWYGRVLVERVEGFCRQDEWERAYREINEMEDQWADFGTVLIKFWLHIDKDEQLRRFADREKTPHKRWKITEEDKRNREKWDLYQAAVDEMLYRTSTTYAPWTIIEANCKLYARIKVLQTVVDTLERHV